MLLNTVSFLKQFYLVENLRLLFFVRIIRFSSYKKHVLRSMFHLDKLHHLRLISEIFQYQGSYRIGNHHSLTFHKDAVTRYCINNSRLLHLLTNLLVTTRSAYYQLRPRLYTFYNSVVSGSVAGVESDQHVYRI